MLLAIFNCMGKFVVPLKKGLGGFCRLLGTQLRGPDDNPALGCKKYAIMSA
jgi:hypothetical protein